MKFPQVVEAWLYGDPEEIGDRLLRRAERLEKRDIGTAAVVAPRQRRDRYYTAARRLHVKQLMRART